MPRFDYDLIVLGAGSAGIVLGEFGARLGARVALIEADRIGGDCTWHGCVPSKALLASAHLAQRMRQADAFGLPPVDPHVDLGLVMDRVRELQERIYAAHDDPQRFERVGCTVIHGRARFIGPTAVEVHGRRLTARAFCIATGSRPAIPPLPGLSEVPYLTNETIFGLRELPRRLLVLGGGPIGVELGQALARLGSQVTIVQRGPRLLEKDDAELADQLRGYLEAEGIAILTSATAERVRPGVAEVRVGGELRELPFDRILVAAGRAPNVAGLGLEAARVSHTAGGITVDEQLRTSNPRIYACGDVIGGYRFTHTAAYEAAVVLQNALFPLRGKASYGPVPWATFTDPELAHVGLTEAQARERYGKRLRVYRTTFADNDRAVTDRAAVGQIKLLSVGLRDRIVGCQILGPAAGELINEVVIAMRAGASAATIASTIHVYPTLSQATLYAAQGALDRWMRHPIVRPLLRGVIGLSRLLDR